LLESCPVNRKLSITQKENKEGGRYVLDRCKNIRLNVQICEHAAMNAFHGKWWRRSTLNELNKYGGVTDKELRDAQQDGNNLHSRLEAVHGVALELLQRLEDLLDGTAPDLDLVPITKTTRVDGLSGKIRELTHEEPLQQCYDHLAVLGLMPLFKAKILPWQYASIPKRGQTGGARRLHRWLNRKTPRTRHAEKVDIHHAYQSTKRDVILVLLREDIPKSRWQFTLVAALLATDPDGALLIGSFLSAWLFNYVMSKFLRYLLELAKVRRGATKRVVDRLLAYMDDVALFSNRLADLLIALKRGGKWLQQKLGLELKPERQHIKFLSIDEERRRRTQRRPGERGCPGLDMMGYIVHRTYITIRWRIFKRARRQFLRAACDYDNTGRIPLYRCYKLVSYYGLFKNSDSRKAQQRLRVPELVKIAKTTIAAAARLRALKRKGEENALSENTVHRNATGRMAGAFA
jgi:hypothetical protein